jgi:SAM-dependent methyltransferase
MAQNVYDDPDFLLAYSQLPRQQLGLDGAPEWPVLETMLLPVAGKRLLDLGCGFGWVCRWAVEHGAASALGVDVSTKMLNQAAVALPKMPDVVKYLRADLDEVVFPSGSADVVFSSLAFHYVMDFSRLMGQIANALVTNGQLVFSVEHPIFSAPSVKRFEEQPDGRTVWPLENYLVQGERRNQWFIDGVRKQHRTVASYLNAVIDAGLTLDRVEEWGPSPEQIAEHPHWIRDLHRPWFLLIAAHKSPS